jgi:hypothetical protein
MRAAQSGGVLFNQSPKNERPADEATFLKIPCFCQGHTKALVRRPSHDGNGRATILFSFRRSGRGCGGLGGGRRGVFVEGEGDIVGEDEELRGGGGRGSKGSRRRFEDGLEG